MVLLMYPLASTLIEYVPGSNGLIKSPVALSVHIDQSTGYTVIRASFMVSPVIESITKPAIPCPDFLIRSSIAGLFSSQMLSMADAGGINSEPNSMVQSMSPSIP